ncbi:MAG: zinc-ribbon domain-containing protein [Pseudomonadota bacterium]
MLISCPACPKVYQVAASAIPLGGREVRCASCKTVWHEPGLDAELVEPRGVPSSTSDILDEASLLDDLPTPSAPFSPRLGGGGDAGDSLISGPSDPVFDAVYADELRTDSLLDDMSGSPSACKEIDNVDEPDGGESLPSLSHRAQTTSSCLPIAPNMAVTVKMSTVSKHEAAAALYLDAPNQTPEDWAPEDRAQGEVELAPASAALLPALREVRRALWSPMAHLWAGLSERVAQFAAPPAAGAHAVSPGAAAAADFRAKVRARAKNRLTPFRALGWCLWAACVGGVLIGSVTQRTWVKEHWPRSANVYALFDRSSADTVEITRLRTRYAQSTVGPILEMRGVIINQGSTSIVPHLTLTTRLHGDAPPRVEPVLVSQVPLPSKGERPFVIRALVPEGTQTAHLAYAPYTNKMQRQRFVLQQNGSGWGQALPDKAISGSDEQTGKIR